MSLTNITYYKGKTRLKISPRGLSRYRALFDARAPRARTLAALLLVGLISNYLLICVHYDRINRRYKLWKEEWWGQIPSELYSGHLFFCLTIHNSDIFKITDDLFFCHLFAKFFCDTDIGRIRMSVSLSFFIKYVSYISQNTFFLFITF